MHASLLSPWTALAQTPSVRAASPARSARRAAVGPARHASLAFYDLGADHALSTAPSCKFESFKERSRVLTGRTWRASEARRAPLPVG